MQSLIHKYPSRHTLLTVVMSHITLMHQVATTVFGIVVGMLKLDLGVLTGWEDVVTEFYRAPSRYGSVGCEVYRGMGGGTSAC